MSQSIYRQKSYRSHLIITVTRMDFEGILLSEMSERKKKTV